MDQGRWQAALATIHAMPTDHTAPTTPLDDDPMPQPPVAPPLEDCCGNGCDPCIFELHDLAMDQYRQALRAWRARHPGAEAG